MALPWRVFAREKRLGHFFGQHELKLLNLSVMLYVCFGALLFYSIDQFDRPTVQQPLQVGPSSKLPGGSLAELRLKSVQRMWNITNQLNILYESNWTKLVLDELVEYERVLMLTLEAKSERDDPSADQDGGGEDPSVDIEAPEEKKEKSSRKVQERIKSIKRSLVHSIATIATIGSPHEPPASSTAKLATIIYGALGIPLLFYSISQNGQRVARSSINLLLLMRHYCLSLPLYYLCCGCCCSCGNASFLTLLGWACCCCLCGRLCCFPFGASRANGKSTKKKTSKCFSHRQAPRLKLLPSLRAPSRGGASWSRRKTSGQETAYTVASDRIDSEHHNASTGEAPKSVRFASQNRLSAAPNSQSFAGSVHSQASDDTGGDYECQYDSFGLFMTTVCMLIAYLVFGAFMYAKKNDSSILESFYTCYQMLSMSKLPDSFGFNMNIKNALEVYKTMRNSPNATLLAGNAENTLKPEAGIGSWQLFVTDLAYFVVGLHLVAMCGHMARFWFIGLGLEGSESMDSIEGRGSDSRQKLATISQCNGHAGSLAGTLSGGIHMANLQQSPIQLEPVSRYEPRMAMKNDHYVVHASLSPVIAAQVDSSDSQMQTQFHQPQQQINLAELFVVGQETQSTPVEQIDYNPYEQQQQQQISDMSLTSDRSSEVHSLCAHHQSQIQLNTMATTNSIHHISGSTCGRNQVQLPPQAGFIYQQHSSFASNPSTMTRARKLTGNKVPRPQADFNGFEQQDSSTVNTIDTMNSNTNSSVSSRAGPICSRGNGQQVDESCATNGCERQHWT